MNYPGGKQKLASKILPLILAERTAKQWYIEPFVGGANVISKVEGPRIGADLNHYLIAFWKAVQNGWIPPRTFSKARQQAAKRNPQKFSPELTCWYAMAHSFCRKWFDHYLQGRTDKLGHNYAVEFWNNIKKQLPGIQAVDFQCFSYYELKLPRHALIYCDPPYVGTVPYKAVGVFDSEKFWQWAEHVSRRHKIFVSEYQAPRGWKCVYERERQIGINQTGLNGAPSKRALERLFTK